MVRSRITAGLAGGVATVVMGTATFACAEEEPTEKSPMAGEPLVVAANIASAAEESDEAPPMPIKQLMGENFAGLQQILIALITSSYAVVPEQANVIHEHALDLADRAPEGSEAERKEFLSYAYNLDAHARDIKSIVELLIEHDRERSKTDLGTTHLRGALAAHYGGMVTMCVACHNRFRPTVIE